MSFVRAALRVARTPALARGYAEAAGPSASLRLSLVLPHEVTCACPPASSSRLTRPTYPVDHLQEPGRSSGQHRSRGRRHGHVSPCSFLRPCSSSSLRRCGRRRADVCGHPHSLANHVASIESLKPGVIEVIEGNAAESKKWFGRSTFRPTRVCGTRK